MDFRIKIECDPVQSFEHMGGFGTYCCFEFHKVHYTRFGVPAGHDTCNYRLQWLRIV
jgi:hypothetical protein